MSTPRSPLRPCRILPLVLPLLLLAVPAAPIVQPPAPEVPVAAGAPGAVAQASYQFTVAKMLIEEGDYRGARAAFERALELDPSAAYVRIEYAEFLARIGRFGRTDQARRDRLEEAVTQAERAVADLPGNVDALRAAAQANLALAAELPDGSDAMDAAVEALEAVHEAEPFDVRSALSLGQIYMRRGRPGDAAEVFQAVVEVTPGYQPVHRFLAEALLQAGRRQEADEPLRRVIETEPENEPARLALAEILAERGDHAEAVEVLRSSPDGLESVEARTRLATELYLSGDLEASSQVLEALMADAPDSRYIRLLRGLVLSAQARNEEALATLEPLLGQGPGDADLAVTVSQLLLREEREEEAVDILRGTVERLEEAGPEAEADQVRLALGRLYAALGRWQTVEETVRPLLPSEAPSGAAADGGADDGGGSLEALLLWADAMAEQDRGREALDRLSGPREDAPPALLSKEVELLARLDRVPEAVEVFESLASADDQDAFVMAAEGLHRAGHFEETIGILERFAAAHPDSVAARFLLGAARERAGRREAAIDAFRELIDDQPEFHPALNYLGYMWIEEGENLEEAMDLVRDAVRLDPDNAAYVDSLGWGFYQLGRHEQARDTLERAARLDQDPTIYEHLGDVYAALGAAEDARRAYRRAIELEADDPAEVARKLAELGDPDPPAPGASADPPPDGLPESP